VNVTVSTGNMGWASMGLVTFIVGVFIVFDIFLQGATGQPLYFSAELRPERLLVAAGATAGWLGVMALYRLTHQVRRPPAAASSQEIPDEPPALANMLANGFEPTREAIPATVLDLAARGVVDVEEVGNDRFQIRLRVRSAPSDLLPFERRVLGLLVSKAIDGVVPTQALTTGQDKQARGWWKQFRREVAAVAQARGLSRDLWRGWAIGFSAMLGLAAGAVTWWAFEEWMAALWYGFLVATVIGSVVEGRRQRDTPLGYRRAGEILGLRRFLREGAFEDLPPTAVAIWERHLAYALGLGVARRSLRAMPMGADDDHRAWSPMGGEWRLVRVRYPHLWPPGWGRMPSVALLIGLLLCLVSLAVLYGLSRLGWPGPDDGLPEEAVRWVRLGFVLVGAAAVLMLARSLLLCVLAISDLGRGSTRSGTVLRIRAYGGSGEAKERHYVAIDDGRSPRIRAFRVPPKHRWIPVIEGKDATATFSPRLGFLRDLRPAAQPLNENVSSAS